VITRGSFGAEHAVAPLDHIQIDLEYALLGHQRFEHRGNHRFLRLSPPRALARKKQVLRQLLRDGGAPRDDVTLAPVALPRLLDTIPVEAVVLQEFCVFGGYQRAFQMWRDFLIRHPLVAQLRVGIVFAQNFQPRAHEGSGAGIKFHPVGDVRKEPELQRDQAKDRQQHNPKSQ
jgi:hypothetical protein